MRFLLSCVLALQQGGGAGDSGGELTIEFEILIEAWLAYTRGEDRKAEAIGEAAEADHPNNRNIIGREVGHAQMALGSQ